MKLAGVLAASNQAEPNRTSESSALRCAPAALDHLSGIHAQRPHLQSREKPQHLGSSTGAKR